MDVLIVIPSLPLLILLASMSKGQTSLLAVGIILVIFNWPFPARQIRAVALTMREREFVNVAWFSGESIVRILCRQILPYLRGWSVGEFHQHHPRGHRHRVEPRRHRPLERQQCRRSAR